MTERKYLHTLGDLIDRLSIVQLKEVFIPEHKQEYSEEIAAIVHDIQLILNEKDAEMNDSAGTHIHVFAADLTTNQVGQVFAAYKWLEHIMSAIAGRQNTSYAMDFPVSYIGSALRKSNPRLTADKPRTVNATPLFTNRGTIEFRQMDCNLDADRMSAWAWIVRGLVTVAKRGATIANYKQVTDLNSLIELFAKFNVEPDNEHPELIIYGSKSDDDKVVRVQHVNTRS
jgi:hypothetical protein